MHIAYDAPTRRRRRSTSHHYAYSKGNPLLTRNLQQSPNIIPSTFISFVLMSTNKRRSFAFVASSAAATVWGSTFACACEHELDLDLRSEAPRSSSHGARTRVLTRYLGSYLNLEQGHTVDESR